MLLKEEQGTNVAQRFHVVSKDPSTIAARHYANAADYAARQGNYRQAAALYKAALYVLRAVMLEQREQRRTGTNEPRWDICARTNAEETEGSHGPS
jgi:hypothetical protein